MGMAGRIARRWNDLNRNYVAATGRASDVVGGLGTVIEGFAPAAQSAILAVSAWLVIHPESTPGIIIAGSILGGRALAPIDLAIANWRGFVGARGRVGNGCRACSDTCATRTDPMPLQPPAKTLVVHNAAVSPPGEGAVRSCAGM